MKSIKEILTWVGAVTNAPAYGNLTKVTSRDGITVYHYGDCVVVKTNNSISITRWE